MTARLVKKSNILALYPVIEPCLFGSSLQKALKLCELLSTGILRQQDLCRYYKSVTEGAINM